MSGSASYVCGVTVSHHDATIEQLEAISTGSQQAVVSNLLETPGVAEALALETCNRVEAYVVVSAPERGHDVLSAVVEGVPESVVVEMGHDESLHHLLRVAAGLDSLVLGEDQILGQVRTAFEDARSAGGIGPVLEEGVTKAIRVGERARTETEINDGVVSLASAAVRLAAERHGLDGSTAAVLGTGKMGTVAAKRLADRVDRLVLVNRTPERAERLAATVEPAESAVEVAGLEEIVRAVQSADVLISATASSGPVLATDHLADAGETFVVDITRPRDVPAGADDLPGVTVYDLDALEAVTEKTRQMRQEAATRVEAIVDEEFEQLLRQYKRNRADRVISAMYESAERVKAQELEETLRKLDLDERETAVVESMADAIVSQLLAAPTGSLRDAAQEDDWTTIHTAIQLFDPNFGPSAGDISPAFVSEMAGEHAGDVSAAEVSEDVSADQAPGDVSATEDNDS